jgi:hypothetical protein
MSKVFAKWVPRQLAVDQKRTRLDISRYLLYRYEDEPDFIYWIVTQDETWVRNFYPASKKTVHAAETPWLTLSADDFFFLDGHGKIMIDYLEQGKTINGTYYADEL